jgi:hypothetical protein
MGPAFPCRKLGKTIRDSPLAASPIPTTASLKRLVNSARFDKAGRTTAANMTPEYQDAFFEPGWHTAASSGGLAAPNPAVPIQYSRPISAGALRDGAPANKGFKITRNCAMHKGFWRFPQGNIEFRTFPQCFLNLLETPVP